MPFPNKRIFYQPEQLMLGGIPKSLHQKIANLADQENQAHKFDSELFNKESDIRYCLNLGVTIYNLEALIKEIQTYLESIQHNTDYAQFIQKYVQTYIETNGTPDIGENPTALLRTYYQSHMPLTANQLNPNQISLLAAIASLKTLLPISDLPNDITSINSSLQFLVTCYINLLDKKSTLEKLKSALKTQIAEVFADQPFITTTPDIHLHTVEIQTLANAIKDA